MYFHQQNRTLLINVKYFHKIYNVHLSPLNLKLIVFGMLRFLIKGVCIDEGKHTNIMGYKGRKEHVECDLWLPYI